MIKTILAAAALAAVLASAPFGLAVAQPVPLLPSYAGTPPSTTGVVCVTPGVAGSSKLCTPSQLLDAAGGGGWTAFTPTAPCSGGGSMTLSSGSYGRYAKIGRTVMVVWNVVLTASNACTGAMGLTLPFASGPDEYIIAGREDASTGAMLQGVIKGAATIMYVYTAANAAVQSVNDALDLSGSYESGS